MPGFKESNIPSNNHHEHFPTKDRLHTDVLREKYGPIHADVLRHDSGHEKTKQDRLREARLVDEENILRTYALTFLTYDPEDTELLSIDDEIRESGLIGETFRQHGYTIKKNVIDVFIMDIPEWMQDDFNVESNKAKARLTEFYAKRENEDTTDALTIYGTVVEIYSPDFKDPNDGINEIDHNQINPLTEDMKNAGIPMEKIWEKLDRASEPDEWGDMKNEWTQAMGLSKEKVNALHKKIMQYLKEKK